MNEDYYYWPTELLIQHVFKVQHLKMTEVLGELKADFNQLLMEFGKSSPQLHELHQTFIKLAHEIESHLSKEAIVIFPFVKRYSKELKKSNRVRKPGLSSACFPIHKMYNEHKKETTCFNLMMNMIATTSIHEKDNFRYNVIYSKLYNLRILWQEQVQVENDILFPKIVEMEATLYPYTR